MSRPMAEPDPTLSRPVLVTGGAGYVGSHIALALLDAGYRVVVADNLCTGLRWLVPDGACFEEVDLRDGDALEQILRRHDIGSVVHCAASTVVPDSVADPLSYYSNNIGATLSLLGAMARAGVRRIIFSSTAAVYRADNAGQPIAEDAPTDPLSPYGATKLMAERILRDTAAIGALDYTILRYFNVAGADPDGRAGQSTPAATHLIKLACETACGRRPSLTIYGTDWPTPDGTGVRDFVHVSDLAQAHIMALQQGAEAARNRIFNCGYGSGYSVRDVVRALEAATGTALPVQTAARRAGDLAQVVADGRALADTLGWQPRYADLNTIIAHSLAWESSHSTPEFHGLSGRPK
ncbi:UDP-glucose 4-epimerase GalE [Roseibaca sp. V10]|uniref:UDP-glucose 4-epimerase n=1 Tax=Roseinatronobacter domitianus TaxID=2940293 RepID=A0ABT0M7L9_9RHOB|nr:UDP-glucose 4-epimerase GalE [Roseibaca domitiana]MCL1630289.1 UDP-glucose 4-epimerase GalE [Roseibaca domitiana]